jgi:hypothetical protein
LAEADLAIALETPGATARGGDARMPAKKKAKKKKMGMKKK